MSAQKAMGETSSIIQKSKHSLLRIIFGRTMLILLLLAANFLILFRFMLKLVQGMPILFGSLEAFTAALLIYVISTDEELMIAMDTEELTK